MGKDFIIRILESSGRPKRQFAGDIGVHPGTINKWLAGTNRPTPEHQQTIRLKFKKEIAKLYKNLILKKSNEKSINRNI